MLSKELLLLPSLRDICTAWAKTLPAAATSQAPSPRRTAAAPAARVVRPSAVPRASSPSPPQSISPPPQVEPSSPRVETSISISISYDNLLPTRSRTQSISLPIESPTTNVIHPASASHRKYPSAVLADIMEPFKETLSLPELGYGYACVLDEETGETLEWRQLRTHPKWKDVYTKSYSNEIEMGRLCVRV